MIARPARVRMRSRKPWVLDRRRLFGWNVRLLTRCSHYDDGAHPPVGGPRRVGAGGAALRTRRLVSADRPHRSAGRPVRGPLRGRQGPSTDEPSIAEVRRLPVTGTTPTVHDADEVPRPAGGAPCHARDSPARRAGCAPGVVARLWTGLLASPSLRVGLQGSGAWADPVGRPTAVRPSSVPERAVDLRRRRPASPPGETFGTSGRRQCTPCGQSCGRVRPAVHRSAVAPGDAVRREPGDPGGRVRTDQAEA